MRVLALTAVIIAGALTLSACETVTIQGVTERAVATKDIATATLNAICERPEDDVVRVDIRKALAKVSAVDSRTICTEGLDKYLSDVVSTRVETK